VADYDELIRAFARNPEPLLLRCGVQHYGWGDPAFIPALLGQPAPASEPQAELWIGDHHDLPSVARIGGVEVPLDRLIDAQPEAVLGAATARYGAQLPFLFKVLAAAEPLSIQAHPNRTQAVVGFAHEAQAGVPANDPRRNYRDPNHKPELLVALTDFYALRGFRPLAEIERELAGFPSLDRLSRRLDGSRRGLEAVYAGFMRAPQAEVDALLGPVVAACASRRSVQPEPSPGGSQPAAAATKKPGADRYGWLVRADALHRRDGHCDRGLLSFLLLNLLHLRPGEAIFLPAGELHSYLDGAGLELMANSNNVLRGGLTGKHIDVDALLAVLNLDPHAPEILSPHRSESAPEALAYRPPIDEFALHLLSICPAPAQRWIGEVALGLVLEGETTLLTPGQALRVGRGGAFLLPAGQAVDINGSEGTRIALATTGDPDAQR
jgi:mannose-6-phosphate isomerase